MENNTIPTKVFALGGIEEIGKNMYVVEHDNEIWIVDCGVKFADENVLFGVNSIICPFDYLVENKEKVQGLLITHAHEDHIGGIPYLLKALPIPKVYGSKLTLSIVNKKLKEHKDLKEHVMSEFDDDTKLSSKYFKIEFFRVCHSIPDAFGIYFETPNGKIVSTGDFRFDFSTQGDQTDILKVAEIGLRDIDLLLCESTNSEREGFSDSEANIVKELKRIIGNCRGRIFLSAFASNLGRIEEIIALAIENNRKIALAGRSMVTNVEASVKSGFLNVSNEAFIEIREIDKFPENQVMVILTGSQGEELAALNQMATGQHPWVALKREDTIILSSSPIPGNFLNVETLVNKLYKTGATVIVNKNNRKIHASGHATQVEQQLFIKLINPKYVLPIHGEYKMLRALKKTCIVSGIHPDNVIQVSNGQKVALLNHEVSAIDEKVDMYDVYVDGNNVNIDSTGLLKYRQILSQEGLFSATIILDIKNKKVPELPILSTRGSFFAKSSSAMITKIAYSIKENIEAAMSKNAAPITNKDVARLTERTVEFFIWKNKKKRPLVRTTIFEV
ncbi:MAG: ribonuclease J [Mycoplasmataceae bacterium]|nr:ribonuclease J [Mycoplasmataceae bacterium]